MTKFLSKLQAWDDRITSLYNSRGYLLAEDLGFPMWFAKLIFWVSTRYGDGFKKMSTVVNDDGRVICFHDKANLLGHEAYPNAHVEKRYTLDMKFFKSKIWPNDA